MLGRLRGRVPDMYQIRMVTYAQELYGSLTPEGRAATDRALARIAGNPQAGDFNAETCTWTWSDRDVVILYSIEDEWVVVTVLRIATLK